MKPTPERYYNAIKQMIVDNFNNEITTVYSECNDDVYQPTFEPDGVFYGSPQPHNDEHDLSVYLTKADNYTFNGTPTLFSTDSKITAVISYREAGFGENNAEQIMFIMGRLFKALAQSIAKNIEDYECLHWGSLQMASGEEYEEQFDTSNDYTYYEKIIEISVVSA